jgi:hypothetical protein
LKNKQFRIKYFIHSLFFTRIFVVESFLTNLRNITRNSESILLSIPLSSIPFDKGNSPIRMKYAVFFRIFLGRNLPENNVSADIPCVIRVAVAFVLLVG